MRDCNTVSYPWLNQVYMSPSAMTMDIHYESLVDMNPLLLTPELRPQHTG
jgi:hypothetical protein